MDLVLANGWRFERSRQSRWGDGGRWFGMTERTNSNVFVWRQGRDEVRLSYETDGWSVIYVAVGKLLGPRQVMYEARHRRATHAAWDVMARVIRASRDESEGLRVAQMAARWMKAFGIQPLDD